MKITKKTTIGEIVRKKPEAVELLLEAGMHCIGCPMSQMETIEEGCLAHGLTKKQIDNLIKKINEIK
jgi:hybrid cluster-associated redox disulfide protein